jgi:hypothetical protein
MPGLLMRDGIALLRDELWPCLDDVQQFEQAFHTPIEVSEVGAPQRAKITANAAMVKPPSEGRICSPLCVDGSNQSPVIVHPLQIMTFRISHETLTLSITIL